jgi:hypothetical protein
MIIEKTKRMPDYIATGILLVYLIAGIFLTADYGVNWDDDAQRRNGLNNWEFITGQNKDHLIASSDKYHGPSFELVLVLVEKAFNLTEYRDIMLARHKTSFIFFALGIGLFFLLCRKLFDSSWLGLAGMLMLLLSPRIFGEGFYNPKDTIFLVAMAAAMYSLLVFIDKPSFPHALFHAFLCAFMIDIRVIGVIIIPITLALIAFRIYQRKIEVKGLWIKVATFLVAEFILMVAMWPILMTGPFHHLFEAYKQLSGYSHWDGLNRYAGGCVSSLSTPWHYHWLWIVLTSPEVYILLFAAGVIILFREAFRKGFLTEIKNLFLLLSLLLFLFPLVFRSIKGSPVYDGWRHVYFVYPFLILLAVYGLEKLSASSNSILRNGALILFSASISDGVLQIIAMHPFEYVYFNHIANDLYKPIDHKFEMDYWGVSYKQGLEYLATHQARDQKINVSFAHYPGHVNFDALPADQRSNMTVTERPDADYYLTTYRDYDICPDSYTIPGELIYTIKAQGNTVLGIYKLK